jgi:hypothetical protein
MNGRPAKRDVLRGAGEENVWLLDRNLDSSLAPLSSSYETSEHFITAIARNELPIADAFLTPSLFSTFLGFSRDLHPRSDRPFGGRHHLFPVLFKQKVQTLSWMTGYWPAFHFLLQLASQATIHTLYAGIFNLHTKRLLYKYRYISSMPREVIIFFLPNSYPNIYLHGKLDNTRKTLISTLVT